MQQVPKFLCRHGGLADSDDGKHINDLFKAFEDGNQEAVTVLGKSSTIRFLDNQVIKLFNSIVVPAAKQLPQAASTEDIQREFEEEGYL